ncbi:MAG TPA: molybdopterin converting factor subunit 1 [Tepidisphaeraceae bacterium]|nr:molybdopterin converting factor subunit 1 [Tepidisphaeraceae bacterium]
MRITVRFFAILRDRAGLDQIELDLNDGATASTARDEIARRFELIASMLPRVALAVNREYVKGDHALKTGDELALIPPVSGG